MFIVILWIVSGLLWTFFAALLLKDAIKIVQENNIQINSMADVQRKSNVMIFLLSLIGLIAADLAGFISLFIRLYPDLLKDYFVYVQLSSIILIILTLNALGSVTLHIWVVRKKLNAMWGNRRKTDITRTK